MARCFGVLGHPIGHSKSPAMHSAAFEALGLPHRYLAFDVDPGGLAAALAGAAALGFGGLNLTVPLKACALPLMDALSPEAEAIGAVNTVCFTDAGVLGRNTDGVGFLESLGGLVGTLPRRAVVLGGGGASRAVAYALAEAGTSIDWVSRRPGSLPAWPGITALGYEDLAGVLCKADVLVNGTTVGMKGGPSSFPVPVEVTQLPARAVVADLVYPAPQAGLVLQARARGLRAMDGLPMLWGQGVLALEHWLGLSLDSPTRTAMRLALGLAATSAARLSM
ncbi:MAG: shikimate dehydrogenase [Nannocystaceae bacterium]|nr:shikimate dehydrogenase [Nannocystaceae bacterium]